MTNRRTFLSQAATGLPALGLCWPKVAAAATRLDEIAKTAPKARFWTSVALAGTRCAECHEGKEAVAGKKHRHDPRLVQCGLCAARCAIAPGDRGRCRARMNVGGELRSLVYGRPVAINVDPIEKKPFYHFLPGSAAYSLSTCGCPLACEFCQNWELSQSSPEDHDGPFVAPAEVVTAAAARKAPVIAYTYNEPTIFTEYIVDIAKAGRQKGLRSVAVSCGFMNEAPLTELLDSLDAIKIDLKGMDEGFYRKVCHAELAPVLRSIKQIAARGVHLEIVNLMVPTLNDSEAMVLRLVDWMRGEVGPDVPLHFTRFHPDYKLLNLPPTPVAVLERARDTALAKGLRYVYVGNVPNHPGNHTYCPHCKKIVIRRQGFFVVEMNVKGGKCAFCHEPVAGVWA